VVRSMASKPKRVSSSLEEQIDEEPVPGMTPQYQIPSSNCPKFCPKFKCIIGERNCHNECENLESAGALICDLCEDEKECSETRRKIILNADYVKRTTEKKTKIDAVTDGFDAIKFRHAHLETSYREKKDQLLTLKWYQLPLYTSINNDLGEIEIELKYIRKVMNTMNIEHKQDIVIDQKQEKKGALNTGNLIMIGMVILLVVIYLIAK